MNLSAKDLQTLTEAKKILAKIAGTTVSPPVKDPSGSAYFAMVYLKEYLSRFQGNSQLAKDLKTLKEAKDILVKTTSIPGWDPTGNGHAALTSLKIYMNSWAGKTEEWDTGELPSELPPECSTEDDTLKDRLEEFRDIIAAEDFDQTIVVEEECTELLKEICKFRRGKGVRENLIEEAVDVITASLVYAQVCGAELEDILDRAQDKIIRAIKRYREMGEM